MRACVRACVCVCVDMCIKSSQENTISEYDDLNNQIWNYRILDKRHHSYSIIKSMFISGSLGVIYISQRFLSCLHDFQTLHFCNGLNLWLASLVLPQITGESTLYFVFNSVGMHRFLLLSNNLTFVLCRVTEII